jgi:hypothetical protein
VKKQHLLESADAAPLVQYVRVLAEAAERQDIRGDRKRNVQLKESNCFTYIQLE